MRYELKMNRTTMILIGIMAVMSACAPKMWIRQDTTRDEFIEDKMQCRQMASAAGSGNPLIINSEFNSCMKDLGYQISKGGQR